MLCPALCRPQERGPFRGQGLPQGSRGRERLGQCRSQNTDTRSQNSRKGKDLEHDERGAQVKWQKPRAKSQNQGRGTMNDTRRTIYEGTSDVTFWGRGFSNTDDAHNEPFRASVWPVPGSLYVVVRHSRSHNSPIHSMKEGLPPGQLPATGLN